MLSAADLRSESETRVTLMAMARVYASVDGRFPSDDARRVFGAWLSSVSIALGVPIATASVMVTQEMELPVDALKAAVRSLTERSRFCIRSMNSDVDRGWRVSCDNLCDAVIRIVETLGPRPEDQVNSKKKEGIS